MTTITACPRRMITQDSVDVLDAATFWDQGVLPVTGGMLDQTAQCVEAVKIVHRERRRYENKRGPTVTNGK